jgi:hypothetical protein
LKRSRKKIASALSLSSSGSNNEIFFHFFRLYAPTKHWFVERTKKNVFAHVLRKMRLEKWCLALGTAPARNVNIAN